MTTYAELDDGLEVINVVIQEGIQGPVGPPGPAIVNENPFAFPYMLADDAELTVGPEDVLRQFVEGLLGPITFTITDGEGTQVLYLFGTNNTNYAELVGDNIILSGRAVLKQYSQIELHWIEGLDHWVEAGRNEII